MGRFFATVGADAIASRTGCKTATPAPAAALALTASTHTSSCP